MKEKGTCVTAGKWVGGTYRKVGEKTVKLRHFIGKAAQNVAEEIKVMTAKFGNLFKKVKTNGQLAHWEMKQKDNFAKLGEEIFRLKESEPEGTASEKPTKGKQNELNNIFMKQKIKEILSQVRDDQAKLQAIKDAVYAQKKRMEEMLIFRHAMDELKSPETRIRRVALRVLERLGRKEAISNIVKLLEDPDLEVRNRAKAAIKKLTALDVQPTPVKQ